MSERKYTDEQIVKALECCINADCLNCPQWSEEWYSGMCNDFLKSVLDLINRQKADVDKLQEVNADLNESLRLAAEANKDLKAEIERLREDVLEVTAILGEIELRNAQIKAEAIKEFAERLKANMCHGYPYLEIEEDLFRRDVDNLVAEMTEGE